MNEYVVDTKSLLVEQAEISSLNNKEDNFMLDVLEYGEAGGLSEEAISNVLQQWIAARTKFMLEIVEHGRSEGLNDAQMEAAFRRWLEARAERQRAEALMGW